MEGICKRIRHTVKPFVGVVRSRHRACDDVGVAPRTQGEPGPKGCRRAQSFWGLGRPKMYHEHGDTPATDRTVAGKFSASHALTGILGLGVDPTLLPSAAISRSENVSGEVPTTCVDRFRAPTRCPL
jgi:hypothetical protein